MREVTSSINCHGDWWTKTKPRAGGTGPGAPYKDKVARPGKPRQQRSPGLSNHCQLC
jgi:hypothetical protein